MPTAARSLPQQAAGAQLRERVQRMRSPRLPMADRFARTRELLAATGYPPPYEPGAQRLKDGPWRDE